MADIHRRTHVAPGTDLHRTESGTPVISTSTAQVTLLQRFHASDVNPQVFKCLSSGEHGTDRISVTFFVQTLEDCGLRRDDPRLKEMFAHLDALGCSTLGSSDCTMTLEQFSEATHSCSSIVYRACAGLLRVASFAKLEEIVNEVHA